MVAPELSKLLAEMLVARVFFITPMPCPSWFVGKEGENIKVESVQKAMAKRKFGIVSLKVFELLLTRLLLFWKTVCSRAHQGGVGRSVG